jgi:ADP-heptose:LPS heptosyltransferase
MRIAISNPDGLGDFVLREPLFTGLSEAGHELLLCARPFAAAAAALVAPGAASQPLDVNPYTTPSAEDESRLREFAGRVRAFAPDLLLIAPFQWTWVEERLSALLPEVPTLGLSGGRYPLSVTGATEPSPWTTVVRVAEDVHEWEKNRKLAEALGAAGAWRQPAFHVGATQLASARDWLAHRGLEPGGYWLGCVGQSPQNAIRHWPLDRWAELLQCAERHGLAFVLAGTPDEAEATEEVRRRAGVRAELITGNPDHFDLLAGLVALAAGYAGRDTGLMHLAAALDLPVFTIMGGGHWPRFLPLTTRARVVTLDVPCRGCGYVCHLSRSYCVKDVPLSLAAGAFDDLLTDGAGNLVVTVPRSAELAAEMERDAASQGRHRLHILNERQVCVEEQSQSVAELTQILKECKECIDELSLAFDERQACIEELSSALDQRDADLEEHQRAIGELTAVAQAHTRLLAMTQELRNSHTGLLRAYEQLSEAHRQLVESAQQEPPSLGQRLSARTRKTIGGLARSLKRFALRS